VDADYTYASIPPGAGPPPGTTSAKPVVLLTEDDEARRFLERTGRGLLHPAHTPEQAITITRDLLNTA
jgi:hypothetical protein